jgi:hypothetical protein
LSNIIALDNTILNREYSVICVYGCITDVANLEACGDVIAARYGLTNQRKKVPLYKKKHLEKEE